MLSWKPEPGSSDDELVEACLAGNEAAWGALIEKYKRLVYSMPAKFRLPPEDSADVFQSVWVDLYRDLPRLEQASAVRGWLMTAATRRCLIYKKRSQRMLTQSGLNIDLADKTLDVVTIQLEAEREQQLREAVSQLPDRCRQMIRMLFYETPARPYLEVARELGLAEGSIGFIRGRCLRRLKALLGEAKA